MIFFNVVYMVHNERVKFCIGASITMRAYHFLLMIKTQWKRFFPGVITHSPFFYLTHATWQSIEIKLFISLNIFDNKKKKIKIETIYKDLYTHYLHKSVNWQIHRPSFQKQMNTFPFQDYRVWPEMYQRSEKNKSSNHSLMLNLSIYETIISSNKNLKYRKASFPASKKKKHRIDTIWGQMHRGTEMVQSDGAMQRGTPEIMRFTLFHKFVIWYQMKAFKNFRKVTD